MSNSDLKLRNLPVVYLERLNLFQHLDKLSESSLDDLLRQLHTEVFNTPKRQLECAEADKVVDVGDDEIQILETIPIPKKERVTLKRKSLSLYSPQKPLRKIGNQRLKMAAASQQAAKLKETMDSVNDKLAALRERERKLLENMKKSKKLIDPTVEDELAAMSGPDVTPIIYVPKPNVLKQDKPRRDMISELPLGDVSLKNLLKNPVHSPEEKFRVLEARDKLYQSVRDRQGLEAQKRSKLIGTCPDMCPEKERYRRFYQAQISLFEMVDYPRNTDVRDEWMVKEYARSSADQDTPLPHDLRPVPVLERTMLHLCRNIADRCEFDDQLLEEWYMFLWDRTRAIRKDLTQQDVCDPAAARLLEQCARFHIHCANRLAGQDLSVYDDKINTENLTKCLQTLKYMYNDLGSVGISSANAPEFLCYSLLLNLNNPAIMTEVRDMPEEILFSAPIRFALEVIAARETKNYIKFFTLVKRTTYLNCCLLRRYFSEMRQYAVETIVRGCFRSKTPAVDVLPLTSNLFFEGVNDCIEHLQICNLQVNITNGHPVVIISQRAYQAPEGGFPILPSLNNIQRKRVVATSQIIWGSALPEEPLERVLLQNSFSISGELKLDNLVSKLLEVSNEKKTEWPISGPFDIEYLQETDVDEGVEELQEDEEEDDMFPSDDGHQFSVGGAELPPFQEVSRDNKPADGTHVISSTNIFATSPIGPFRGFAKLNDPSVVSQPKIAGFSFSNVFGTKSQEESPNGSLFTVPAAPVVRDESTSIFKPSGFAFTFKPAQEDSNEAQRLKESESEKQKRSNELELKKQAELELARKIDEEEKLRKAEEEERRQLKLAQEREKLAEERRRHERQAEERKRTEIQKAEERRKQMEREAELETQRLRVLEENKLLAENQRQKGIRQKKLINLRKQYSIWKQKVFFNHWRAKAWAASEKRRIMLYRGELHKMYPLVCNSDLLGGNPHGVIIPNVLLVQRRAARGLRRPAAFRREMPESPPPALPLVHIGRAVAASLKNRVRTLYPDPNEPFRTIFPWKLLLCLPDSEETSIRLDTFLEMHFVERFDWKFGVDSGPLANCIHQIDSLQLHITVRRVKGRQCFEGALPNQDATTGVNSYLFFLTDDSRSLPIAHQRLKKLQSVPGGSLVPLVVFVFGNRLTEDRIRRSLNLGDSSRVIICSGNNPESLVTTLSESLSLAASITSPVPSVRAVTIKSFLKTGVLNMPWRRASRAITNFDILLKSPEPLITYYNECISDLSSLLMDRKLEEAPRLAPEFENVLSGLEAPLELRSIPKRDSAYCIQLEKCLNALKLPAWPSGRINSTDKLNYKLHQYIKCLVGGDKLAQKHLKWRIYRIIQRSLLWKGLDIYCDEDINLILLKFPWVDVFEEFARVKIEKFIQSERSDLVVMFDKNNHNEFYFNSSLVEDLVRSATDLSELGMDVDLDATLPRPEYDSVLIAYAVALEREAAEEELRHKQDDSQSIRTILNETNPDSIQESDTGDLKRGFEQLENNLSVLESRLKKRRSDLEELLAEVGSPGLEQTINTS